VNGQVDSLYVSTAHHLMVERMRKLKEANGSQLAMHSLEKTLLGFEETE